MFTTIINFLKEVGDELKKVSWPTRKETTKLTLIVIGGSVVIAVFLGVLDFIFSFLMNKFVV